MKNTKIIECALPETLWFISSLTLKDGTKVINTNYNEEFNKTKIHY